MCGESARIRFTSSCAGCVEVELAILREDLLGVRDAVCGLRLEVRVGDDCVEQARRDLRRALVNGARVVVRADVERPLRRDRACVELLRSCDGS